MIILKIAAITVIVLIILFILTLIIYFFDMKFAACLIKPFTAYYNWSGNRRKKHKEKQKEKQQG